MESEDALRPNIRIEIHNNLMDTEEDNKLSDGEDGEILDTSELIVVNEDINILERPSPTNKMWSNQRSIETSTNLFDEDEQQKLSGRAKRFALQPNEIKNFTSEQMQELYDSLGITDENDTNIHFHSLHMHGTDVMTTEDVFQYFGKYTPVCVEWVSDESCNVVWGDMTAAKALYNLSQAVNGMPIEVVNETKKDDGNEGRSILLRNKNREIEMQEDDDIGKENYPKISDITIAIPLGYWRLGLPHEKSKCILLRFAMKTDAKPYRAERVDGGVRGLISESAKQRYKGIFHRNREIEEDEGVKNPWGSLAKNWNEDIQFAEREPQHEVPIIQNKMIQKNPALQHRLGFKRAHKSAEKEKVETEVVAKVKAPRMRMYADEEEAKIRRKRQLLALKTVVKEESDESDEDTGDLRKRLPARRRPEHFLADLPLPVIIDAYTNMIEPDLGAKLKNRALKQQAMHVKDESIINAREILTAKRQRNGDIYRTPAERTQETVRSRTPDTLWSRAQKTVRSRTPDTVWSRTQDTAGSRTQETAGSRTQEMVRSHHDARNLLSNERKDKGDARDRLQSRNNNKDRLSNRFTSDDRYELAQMSKQDRLGVLLSKDDNRLSNRSSNNQDRSNERLRSNRMSSINERSRNKERSGNNQDRLQLHSRSSRGGERLNDRRNKSPPARFGNRMHSDRYEATRSKKANYSDYEDTDFDDLKTNSKVTVVIKKQRTPAVASTVWSRMNNEKERLKTVSEGKLRVRKDSTSSNSSSNSSSSSSSSDTDDSSDSDRMAVDITDDHSKSSNIGGIQRPGFKDFQTKIGFNAEENSLSPLRIEINNDHFKK